MVDIVTTDFSKEFIDFTDKLISNCSDVAQTEDLRTVYIIATDFRKAEELVVLCQTADSLYKADKIVVDPRNNAVQYSLTIPTGVPSKNKHEGKSRRFDIIIIPLEEEEKFVVNIIKRDVTTTIH